MNGSRPTPQRKGEEAPPRDYSDLRALYINCTLKRSRESRGKQAVALTAPTRTIAEGMFPP